MFTCFYRFRFDCTTKNIKSTECDFAMQTAWKVPKWWWYIWEVLPKLCKWITYDIFSNLKSPQEKKIGLSQFGWVKKEGTCRRNSWTFCYILLFLVLRKQVWLSIKTSNKKNINNNMGQTNKTYVSFN